MRVLFLGDVVGKPGRQAVAAAVPALRERYQPSVVLANAENSAGGLGLTRRTVAELRGAGVDILTSGNHVFAQKEAEVAITEVPELLRPANYPPGTPGRGWGVFPVPGGGQIAVLNLMGRTFMADLDCPFRVADRVLPDLREQTHLIIVDMHAEATSEKQALARYLDGRVSVVIGTHTHVQTADEMVLAGGTAFISDVGMVGPRDSVLGMRPELAIRSFLTKMPTRLEVARGAALLCGLVVDLDDASGRAEHIGRIQEIIEPEVLDGQALAPREPHTAARGEVDAVRRTD